jgi:hypothetical protein
MCYVVNSTKIVYIVSRASMPTWCESGVVGIEGHNHYIGPL